MEGDDIDKVVPSTSTFEPLRAIYDPDFETESSTKVHDNVEKCVAFLEGRWTQKTDKKKPVNKDEPVLQRQFLPDQLPIASRGRKQFRHVLKRMDEFNSTSGPLFVLKRCRDNKTRVKVWTRGVAGVRGVLTGFIAAFDKVRLNFIKIVNFGSTISNVITQKRNSADAKIQMHQPPAP